MAMKLTLFCFAAVILHCQGNVTPDTAAAAIQPRVGQFNRYYVYTSADFRNPVPVLATVESIAASPILLEDDTVIIVHGLGASAFTSLNDPLRDVYMLFGGYNVITVDWSIFANQAYAAASAAVPMIGASLGEFITLLEAGQKVVYGRLHLVGFGLGAHVVGFAGRNAGGTVARITGLDPAGAGWGLNSLRLRSSDAAYVEVIHTDGVGTNANGIGEPIGHVDFFANRGRSNQPGCSNNACSHNRYCTIDADRIFMSILKLDNDSQEFTFDTKGAWELFQASIEREPLLGTYCETLALMTANRCVGRTAPMGGNQFQKFASGIFTVPTGRVYPFNR